MNFIKHFNTITKHKYQVAKLCFKIGLYRQGLLHDLSKYSWIEFSSGVRHYQGHRSPIDAERELFGVSLGWLHHKGRNPHHWEYWMDNARGGLKPVEIPLPYLAEMFCDRVAASKIYLKDTYNDASPLNYYQNGLPFVSLHPNSAAIIEDFLTHLVSHGEQATLAYIKQQLKQEQHKKKETKQHSL
ncbi:MAG: DUF5662 family protein [Erysipelotrichaceae bacterium]